jgi:hypothetical protein
MIAATQAPPLCSRDPEYRLFSFLAKHIRYELSYKRVCKNGGNLRGRILGIKPSYKSVLFYDTFLNFIPASPIDVSQQKCAMSVEGQMRVACYLRVSTESQELDNQRTEILPLFIDEVGSLPTPLRT